MITAAPKPNSRRRLITFLVILAVVSTGAYAALANRDKGPGEGGEPAWTTAPATMGDISITVTGMGPLQAGHSESVKGTIGGIVRRVLVKEGDRVTAGQILAELDNETVLLDLEQAQLSYQAELDRLGDLRATGASGSSAIRMAELAVETARATVERLEAQAKGLIVTSPATGLLTELAAAASEEVSAGATLGTLLEQRPGRVSIEVPEGKLGSVHIGGEASVITGPLPTVHIARLPISDVSLYALRVGDPVTATVDGNWIGDGSSSIVRGTVVEIVKGETFFDVTCRLPGVPKAVPAGARAPYIQIFPSGSETEELVIVASGTLSIMADEWGLLADHLAGKGLPAKVVGVATEGKAGPQGDVTYTATIELLDPVEGARTGMSAHASISLGNGKAVSGETSYQAPAQKLVTSSGGKVVSVTAKAGTQVKAGDVLLTLSNPSLLQQLEQARIDLTAKERELAAATSSDRAGREFRLQEIRVRQAELSLINQEEQAAGLVLTAGTSGRVVGWNYGAQVGAELAAGFEFCKLINYDTMSMALSVDEMQVVNLRTGMEAEIVVDALPGRQFRGRVRDIANEGKFEMGMSTFDVTIELDGAPELRAQMTANATIRVAEKSNVLIVPAEAVTIFGNGRGEVSVLGASGLPEPRQVSLGLVGRAQVEILDGLQPGENVVLGRARGGPEDPRFRPGGGKVITM